MPVEWTSPPRPCFGPVPDALVYASASHVLRARLHRQVLLSGLLRPDATAEAGFLATFGDGRYVDDLYVRRARISWPRLAPGQVEGLEDPDDLRLRCAYGGVLFGHFGHFLIESLSRFWWLKSNPAMPVLWHAVVPRVLPWQQEIFGLLGMAGVSMHLIARPLKVAQLVVPELGFVIQNQVSDAQARALGVVPFGRPDPSRRIWLSRSALPGRGGLTPVLERCLEERLRELGWHVLHPEALAVAEQLDALKGARTIAGIEGSAFHLLLLGRDIESQIRIVRRDDASMPINSNYMLIANAKNLDQKVSEFSMTSEEFQGGESGKEAFVDRVLDFMDGP
ncbi:glycosyltransferase 61 family protein [Roseomonas sp. HF4]|uniref:glycosyltransferase 61 family protein n=1 Tax=Roseomonas sp. HF4 TaxID=2562313 RepID=UPI0010C03537|nr:glycosyltransferase 61 family protein [Roseomonas sp. HF4]